MNRPDLAAKLIAADCRAGRRTDLATIKHLLGDRPLNDLAIELDRHVDRRPLLARIFRPRP